MQVSTFAKEALERKFKNKKIEPEESLMMRLIKRMGYKHVSEFYKAIAEEVLDVNTVIEQYQEQIARQIQYFHEVAPQAKILFIGPSDMGKSVNGRIVTWPRLPEMVDSLKATALRNDAAYWDLFRMMGGENSMGQWVKHSPALAGPDYIHFTPAGAQKVGDAFTRSLLTYFDFYQLRKTLPSGRVQEALRP